MPLPDMPGIWLLGIDGGGTKTHFTLATLDHRMVATYRGPASYHIEIGMGGVEQVLRDGITAVLDQAGARPDQIAHAFFGLPAFGENSAADARLAEIPQGILGHDRFTCDNDMVCAWAGALGGADGINIVAGTGSIAYGEREARAARCAGWGEIFGDEGSAYWTAIRGLNLFTRMSDGRLPRGPLYTIFREELGFGHDTDVLVRFLEEDSSRNTIAALAPLVARAADAGDEEAVSVFATAATELARLAVTVAGALGYRRDEQIAVSYTGGMLSTGTVLVDRLRAALAGADGRMVVDPPRYSPQEGAIRVASKYAAIGQGRERLARANLAP